MKEADTIQQYNVHGIPVSFLAIALDNPKVPTFCRGTTP